MHKVVLDTNVIASAAISPLGNPAKILDMVLDGEITLHYCDDIMREYADVLSRERLNIPEDLRFDIIRGIERVGVLVNQETSTIPLPDEDDRAFYDTAKQSRAILVTGNTKHYPEDPEIITPASFVDMVES
jgi:putative PIN family toxin of toxin-antitoxin system